MKKILHILIPFLEIILSPLIILSALFFRTARTNFFNYFPITRYICIKCGMIPVIDHYYYPLINDKYISSLEGQRKLEGIHFNIKTQINFLHKFVYQNELQTIPNENNARERKFFYNNNFYEVGDSQYLYSIIRLVKPKKYIEIGSGYSTLMALKACEKNRAEGCTAEVICIEPYEQKWLEQTDAIIMRKKVEDLDDEFFEQLEENDILFIDSSHVVRPGGDVLHELEVILPKLKSGVYIHFHDIFTPYHYSRRWIFHDFRFWNEQYLLEAFLSYNDKFEIIGMLNYLKKHYFSAFQSACPMLKYDSEPGAFWIRKK